MEKDIPKLKLTAPKLRLSLNDGDATLVSSELFGNFQLAEAMFDEIDNIAFFVKDREARYVFVNETIVKRCRVADKSELMGHTTVELFPEPLGRIFNEQDTEVIESGFGFRDRMELHLYPGLRRGWCLTSKFPLVDSEDRTIGLAGISRDLHAPGDDREEMALIAEVAARIREDFGEAPRLSDLAESAGLSVSRMERAMKSIYKMTPGQLLTQTRLDAACRLLTSTDKSITQIALDCGYGDHSAFSRQFRASIGMSPSEYRAYSSQEPPVPK